MYCIVFLYLSSWKWQPFQLISYHKANHFQLTLKCFKKNYFIYVKVIYNYHAFYCSQHVTFGQRYTYKPNPQAERKSLAYVRSMLSKMLGTPALQDQKVNTIQYVWIIHWGCLTTKYVHYLWHWLVSYTEISERKF